MTFEELKAEYEKSIIGEKIYALLTELSAVVAKKFPSLKFNNGSPWNAESIAELCQEIATEQLLGENQIHYIFREANNLDSVRALFVKQIKRGLNRRGFKSPVDRLITRVKSHAKNGEIEAVIQTKSPKYSFSARGVTVVAPPISERQISDCANLLRQIPIIYTRLDTSRETMIFSPENLLKALDLIFGQIGSVSEPDLHKIFENLLTPWTQTILYLDEPDYDTTNNPTAQGQERGAVFDEVRRFAEILTNEEKIVLVHKSNDISDESVASIIKKSRPTVAKIKADSFHKVKNKFLSEVDLSNHEFAMHALIDELSSRIEGIQP
jgi:hypothetical protein